MSIVGNWKLFYSWGCSGTYNETSLTFANNGTFKTGDGFSGQWATVGANAQWVYEPTPSAVYSGIATGGDVCGTCELPGTAPDGGAVCGGIPPGVVSAGGAVCGGIEPF